MTNNPSPVVSPMKLFLVHFRIDGFVEIEAKDNDQAWVLAHGLSLRDLVDGDPVVTVAIEYLESQEE